MPWRPTELAGFVSTLRNNDYKAHAVMVAGLVDRLDLQAAQIDALTQQVAQQDIDLRLTSLITETNQSRAVDTPFTAHTSRPVLGIYTVHFGFTLASATVTLTVDGLAKSSVSLTIGVAALNDDRLLVGLLPPNTTVSLVTSGGGAPTISATTELVL